MTNLTYENYLKQISMSDKHLSEYDKSYLRNLFIERLLNICNYWIAKDSCVDEMNDSDYDYIKDFIKNDSIRVDTYTEVILSMTSEELETIEDVLKTLGYDEKSYSAFKKLLIKYK